MSLVKNQLQTFSNVQWAHTNLANCFCNSLSLSQSDNTVSSCNCQVAWLKIVISALKGSSNVASSAMKMKISRRHNMSRTFTFSPDLTASAPGGVSFSEIVFYLSSDKGCDHYFCSWSLNDWSQSQYLVTSCSAWAAINPLQSLGIILSIVMFPSASALIGQLRVIKPSHWSKSPWIMINRELFWKRYETRRPCAKFSSTKLEFEIASWGIDLCFKYLLNYFCGCLQIFEASPCVIIFGMGILIKFKKD